MTHKLYILYRKGTKTPYTTSGGKFYHPRGNDRWRDVPCAVADKGICTRAMNVDIKAETHYGWTFPDGVPNKEDYVIQEIEVEIL